MVIFLFVVSWRICLHPLYDAAAKTENAPDYLCPETDRSPRPLQTNNWKLGVGERRDHSRGSLPSAVFGTGIRWGNQVKNFFGVLLSGALDNRASYHIATDFGQNIQPRDWLETRPHQQRCIT